MKGPTQMTATGPSSPESSGSDASSARSPDSSPVPPPAATAAGLWTMADAVGRVPLDATLIASMLHSQLDPPTTGRDLVETHLLLLEDAGFLSLAQGDRSWWIVMSPPLSATPLQGSPAPRGRPYSSTAVEREKEGTRERESERERARERAWERVRDEDQAAAAKWAYRDRSAGVLRKPVRPLELDAPPLGCPDHPGGLVGRECGPCGTAADQRKLYLKRERYAEQMAEYEERLFDESF